MKSIFENKHLLDLFYKIAQTPVKEEPITFSDISYALNNLGKQLNGAPKLSFEREDVGPTANVGPKTEDFSSLSSLLKYLATNRVSADGILLSIRATDKDEDQNYPTKGYVLIGEKEGVERKDFYGSGAAITTGKYGEEQYWVHKDSLIKYIRYLQLTAFNEKDKVMEVMLGKLIDKLNKFYDTGLTRKPTSVPGESVNALDDNVELDKLPKVLDIKNPLTNGNIPLLAKDIKDATTLNSWMDANSIMIGESNWKDGNKCDVIKILFARAKYLNNNAKSQEEKKNSLYYMKQVKEISSQFVGPDGKTCQVEGKIPTTSTTGSAISSQALAQLIILLPFHPDYIYVQRFNAFNAAYLKLHPAIADKIQDVDEYYNKFGQYTNKPQTIFPLPSGAGAAKQYIQLTKQPPTYYFKPLIETLQQYVTSEKLIVTDLLETFGGGGYGGAGTAISKFTEDQVNLIQANITKGEQNLAKLAQILQEYSNLPYSKESK